ncbi:MAG TPA: lysine--tRNA ligase [Gaiellales bacterium]|jgi:lysyl-tRNA synthetase class 2
MVGLPHRFADRSAVADVLAAHEDLEAGAASGTHYRLAGRVLGRRGMGKAAFLDLEDRSGRIQLMASSNGLGDQYDTLTDVALGDIVGVSGEAVRSRRGELSLQLDSYALLAHNERPLPDKHHGLADVETRYRQRYLDLLANPEVRAIFELRARAITALRRELDGAGFVEVETPTLQPLYGGANARPFTTHHNELDRDLYLRIATELYLKRLIVGGLERVYEIGKNFRNEGVSFKHNPEFTLLEWYEAYADAGDAMTRTESLVAAAAVAANGSTRVMRDGVEIDLAPPWPRIPLMRAIQERTGIDALAVRDPDELRRLAIAAGAAAAGGDKTWPQLVDRLLSHFVEPQITSPVFLVDYPVELSPLARRREDDPTMVERFEAFAMGMEIANGFSELNDPADQLSRFEEQVRNRAAGDDDAQPLDEDYVEALRYGMPPTGGVGLGIDRLVMLLADRASIRDVILFPALRT